MAAVNSSTLRLIGFVFLIAAIISAVLNLKRVADLGMTWLTPVLLICGVVLVAAAKRRRA